MVRKCRGIAGIAAVMDVASSMRVRTRSSRSRAAALAMAAKRRKVLRSGGELSFSSAKVVRQRRRRRIVEIMPENSVSSLKMEGSELSSVHWSSTTSAGDRCSSSSSDHVPDASCCSSKGSSELVEDRIEFLDLQSEQGELEVSVNNCDRRRKEKTPPSRLRAESDELESTAREREANSHRKSPPEKMPSGSELEEFFAAAEKDIQTRFKQKYNYDVVKDVPLEGRYEWIRLKP